MFGLDAFHLARIQFAFTVSFHIIFPAITIGLASFLAVLEGLWLKTRNDTYKELYHFWSKIFAVNFGMGVVSGLVMAYQFGTNWSGFSQFAGSITGPLLKRVSLVSCCLAGIVLAPVCTSLLPVWWRWGHCFPRSGSCHPIAGCRLHRVMPSRMVLLSL